MNVFSLMFVCAVALRTTVVCSISTSHLAVLGRHKRQSPAAKTSSFATRSSSSSRFIFSSLPLKPSRDIVPIDIVDIPNPLLDPRPEDLNTPKLLEHMGADYDRELMAVDQPLRDMIQYPNGKLAYSFSNSHAADEVPPEARLFENDDIKLGQDGPTLQMRFSRRTRQKLQRFLWAFSYCPVRYKWKQLHQRFWPRWVREGSCDRGRSCSIPAGMQCQPKGTKMLKLLRFHCPYSEDGTRVCKWIKINYPILNECSCGCDSAIRST